MQPVRLSIIMPTISRPTLARALASIRWQNLAGGDEVILVGDGPQPAARDLFRQFCFAGRYVELPKTAVPDWGHTPRNLAFPFARGTHLAALDDDDEFRPGAIDIIRNAVMADPDRPHIFRQAGCPHTGTQWTTKTITLGNVGTPMLVTPNDPARLGRYALRYGGDCDFIRETCEFYPDGPVWNDEVIALIRPSR